VKTLGIIETECNHEVFLVEIMISGMTDRPKAQAIQISIMIKQRFDDVEANLGNSPAVARDALDNI
jgi:hypothetical protein